MSASASKFGRWVESRAQELRARLPVGRLDPLDPYGLAKKVGIPVVSPLDARGLDPKMLAHLLGPGASSWSAGTISLPDGRLSW